jgi:putative ABC transport system permease protein
MARASLAAGDTERVSATEMESSLTRHSSWATSRLRVLVADVRFALRLVRRSPGFSTTLIGVLALGIGATTAMFSLVASLLLRPLPYPHPEELALLTTRQPLVDGSSASMPDFLDWRDQGTTFESLAAVSHESFSLSSEGQSPESLHGTTVSGDFFSVFGVEPLRGRLLRPEDDRVGGARVAVISAALWQRRFGSDPGVVGRTILLNGELFTVVGIAPRGFRFSRPIGASSDVWTPLAVTRHRYALESSEEGRSWHFLSVVGRRKAGASLDEAQAQMAEVAKRIAQRHPETNANVTVVVRDLHEVFAGETRNSVWVLFAAVLFVFLGVCANVANLLLVRASTRRAEMAARAALGATRGRLVAQLVTETLVVFVLGALVGTGLAWLFVDFFAEGLVQGGSASTIDIHVDGWALAFAIATAAVGGFLASLGPAREASRLSPGAILRESGPRASLGRGHRALRGGLVVVQVALAVALLAGSALALRAYAKVASTAAGFDGDKLATAQVVLPESNYREPATAASFYRDVLDRIAREPGVISVAANNQLPMVGGSNLSHFTIEGRPPWPSNGAPALVHNIVTPGYFRTMGIPILRGRDFTEADVAGGRMVIILAKATSDRFFAREDPIGRRLSFGGTKAGEEAWLEIIGVAGDVRRDGLSEPIELESYAPMGPVPLRWMGLAIRTADRPERILDRLPAIVAAVDSRQAVARRTVMTDLIARSVGPQRFVSRLLGAFAAAALVLAALGIFGLVSYTTSQRTRELGIRFALGSSPEGVVGVVMKDGVRLLGAGLLVGVVGALFVGRVIATRVAGAAAFDATVFVSVLAVVAGAGALASFLPALRAVRIPPATALRHEG